MKTAILLLLTLALTPVVFAQVNSTILEVSTKLTVNVTSNTIIITTEDKNHTINNIDGSFLITTIEVERNVTNKTENLKLRCLFDEDNIEDLIDGLEEVNDTIKNLNLQNVKCDNAEIKTFIQEELRERQNRIIEQVKEPLSKEINFTKLKLECGEAEQKLVANVDSERSKVQLCQNQIEALNRDQTMLQYMIFALAGGLAMFFGVLAYGTYFKGPPKNDFI